MSAPVHDHRSGGHTPTRPHFDGGSHDHADRRSGNRRAHGRRQHGRHGGGSDHGASHGGGGHGRDDTRREGVAFEAGKPGEDGKPGRGPAVVVRGKGDEARNGPGHHGDEPCRPTAEQDAAADRLYRETAAVLTRYENAPQRALADGFYYAFGPTDRIIHMVSPSRTRNPTILEPTEIESFLYAVTDRGLMPIGGMYILPEHGMSGPEIGGCRTRWHHHGGLGGRLASGGTMEETPQMLHVWTYPGLEPYGHYDGRELSQLWKPGSYVPSVCREFGDANDVCVP